MMHLHFGAGRLGLGLVAPFFQTPGSQLHLLNRTTSGTNATGETSLSPERRNHLLRSHPEQHYVVQPPSGCAADKQTVRYDGFHGYKDGELRSVIRPLAEQAFEERAPVFVTASVLKPENYGAVMQALDILTSVSDGANAAPPVFLVACENTLSAPDLLGHPHLAPLVTPGMQERVTPVRALVDRMCVGLEEDGDGTHPAVLARAERYGSLKLELCTHTEALPDILRGSRVEVVRHVETEKQIKNWLLNGTHWLIALHAFQEEKGDRNMKLNEYLNASPAHSGFAHTVMQEMRDGVAALLRSRPEYRAFVRDVDVDQYLNGAAAAVLQRFFETEDPITRILARFQAPSHEELTTVEAFSQRFADRVGPPVTAYEEERGVAPPASSHSILSFVRLVGSGTYINAGH
jgi:mannitol-1-phosphate/altronate dehydrogenase